MTKKELKLLNILSLVDLKEIKKSEINYFKNKKVLITGVSGIIGINLLFFFNALIDQKKIKINVEKSFSTYSFLICKSCFFSKLWIKILQKKENCKENNKAHSK